MYRYIVSVVSQLYKQYMNLIPYQIIKLSRNIKASEICLEFKADTVLQEK